MKILISYHFFPHYRGGVIQALARSSDEYFFYGAENGSDGINSYNFNDAKNFIACKNYSVGSLLFQPGLIYQSIFGKYDAYVFLANPNFISTWIAAAICRLRGLTVVFWGHGFKTSENNFKNKIREVFFSLANSYYTYGWRAKKNAVKLGFDTSSIHVGFNSLDYERQLPLRLKLIDSSSVRKTDDVLEILCISRLTYICRYDILLKAVEILNEKGISIRIRFVGAGPERNALQEQAQSMGLNVEFLGEIYDEEVISSLLFTSDVTVSPGKVGLTAMHSLMFGTPVISHNNFLTQMPEVESIVSGYSGDFFQENSIVDLARSLIEFRGNFPDREYTRSCCFEMIDKLYNPENQRRILQKAILMEAAETGNDAFLMFRGRAV